MARVIQAIRQRQSEMLRRFQRFDARLWGKLLDGLRCEVATSERALVVAQEAVTRARRRHRVRSVDVVMASARLRRARAARARWNRYFQRTRGQDQAVAGEFTALWDHPRVRAVWVNRVGTALTIYPDTITIRYGRHRYEIGDFCLVCRLSPVEFSVKCLRSTFAECSHPHENYRNSVCFGGAYEELEQYLAYGDYVAFVDLAVHQLEQRAPGHPVPYWWRKI